MIARYGPRAATFEKAMERMWDKSALIEDDDDEEEGPPRKRTRVIPHQRIQKKIS